MYNLKYVVELSKELWRIASEGVTKITVFVSCEMSNFYTGKWCKTVQLSARLKYRITVKGVVKLSLETYNCTVLANSVFREIYYSAHYCWQRMCYE